MTFKIDFKDLAKEELKKHKKSGQKLLLAKIERFTLECMEDPRSGTGKPEWLKYRNVETWSREINKQHRFVYEIEEDKVTILSVWGTTETSNSCTKGQ